VYYRLQPDHGREAEVYRALATFYPDELEYRFQLCDALGYAGRYLEAVAVVAACARCLRR